MTTNRTRREDARRVRERLIRERDEARAAVEIARQQLLTLRALLTNVLDPHEGGLDEYWVETDLGAQWVMAARAALGGPEAQR